ncbi:MAG: SdrD B-like domain-containing protein [Bacteroidota bacterium]
MKIKFLHTLVVFLTCFAITSNAQNSLAVTVFEDIDGNGLQDAGEPDIPGVLTTELRLWQDNNNNGAIDGGDTEFMHDNGVGGLYTFGAGNVLPDDNYILEYVEAGGPGSFYVTKLVNGVGVLDNDNDLDPMSNTAGFPLTGGVSETLIDLGLVIAGDIGGDVWEDSNGDGLQDAGEPAITSGVTVTLLDAMTMAVVANDIDFLPLTNPAVTDGAGMYSFDNLPPGQYIIEFAVPAPSPDLWYPTFFTVNDDATDATNDSDAENNSAAANYLQTHTIILLSDEIDEEERIDAGFFQASIIGDQVWEDVNGDGIQDAGEPGLNGVTVSLLDDTGAPAIGADGLAIPDQITANILGVDGSYEFTLVAPGDYQVQFSLPAPIGGVNWYPTEFNPADDDNTDPDLDSDANNDSASPDYLRSHLINIVSNEEANGDMNEDTRIDAGFWLPARVGNMVFCDENGNGVDDDGAGGVGGVDVELIDVSTGVTALDANGNALMATSDGFGMYLLELVPPGNYFLRFSFNASVPDPPFTFTLQDDPNGVGGGTDMDDSDVDPDPFGGTYGETMQFEIVSQDIEEEEKWDAGVYQLIDITGIIWLEDDGGNFLNDAGELGPSNIFVELIRASDLAKIDDNTTNLGQYEFLGIPPGEYFIQYDVTGTTLENATPCPGEQDPNDMVDSDDNGPDTAPIVQSGAFMALSNCDPNTPPEINYVDFCYFISCSEENDFAATACDNIAPIDIICEINTLSTFCNIMPTGNSPGNQPNPTLCPGGGAPHNISWFAFVAYGGNYSVTVTPTGCTGSTTGQEGVQIGLYTDCTFTETIYCNPNCSEAPVTFNSDGSAPNQTGPLEEGQVYYFFIDGCSSSVCSYEVSIDGFPQAPDLSPDDMCINDNGTLVCDDASYCPDADVIFEATGINLTVDFTWSITTLNGGPFTGDANPMTEEEMLTLNFENEGLYRVCLDVIDNGCQVWNQSICRDITIAGIDDEEFDPETVCMEDLMSFDPSVLEDADAVDPMDPNGDGTSGWQGPTSGFTFGTNNFMVTTDDGCMYEQEFELMMHPVSDDGEVDMTICREELPFMIDQLELTDLSFAGTLIFDLEDYLLQNSVDQNGCDSVIDINVELLDVIGGDFIMPLTCIPEGIIMTWDNPPGLSTDESFWTLVWTDPMGNVLPDDVWNTMDPKDNLAPVGIGSGTYTLTITIEKNGVTCMFDYAIDINFDDFLPPTPTIANPGLNVCEADSIVVYAATDFGDAFDFTWDWPNDVASGVVSGPLDDTLTVNWSGSLGGEITLIGINGCGEAQAVPIMINVIPQPTPSFDFVNEVCVDSCTTIVFPGDISNIDVFNWDFDGGTENNSTGGTGPGPHCVSWSDPGEKTISLSYVDNSGCLSLITVETVNVIEPLEPPVPTCTSQLGEVTFMWNIIAGTMEEDYSVEVTTGQTTGSISGNTYTVTGLGVNEQVDITITIQTNDACVEITTTATCIAQDCVPPIVSVSAPGDVTSYCLDGTDQSFNLIENIPMGVSGTGVFSGMGIIDTLLGTFNPDSAQVGNNSINYIYNTDDGCTAAAQITIEVLETPVPSFTSNVDTICITDQFELTYDGDPGINTFTWDFGPDATPVNQAGPTPTVSYSTPGDKTIRLFVERDGCESESIEISLFVQPELDELIITCEDQQIDMVEFGWNAVAGAELYEVSINGGTPFLTNMTSHLETGLNPNDIVTIQVTVLSNSRCPGDTDTQECTAVPCPDFIISIDPIADLCVDGSNTPITLQATATGGVGGNDFTWSGPGVTGDQFDPNGLPEGTVEIFVIYQEGSCQGDTSVMVNITSVPTAAFSVDNATICVGEPVNITYEGSQLPGQTVTWTADADVTNLGGDQWQIIYTTPGTFDIQLDVVNGACTAVQVSETITVEPELQFGDISCSPGRDSIAFSWDPVDCATTYEVFITLLPSGMEESQGIQTETEFIVSGLDVNQEVQIRVEAISDCACPSVQNSLICETEDCTPVTLMLSTVVGDTEFCNTDDLGIIELQFTPEGTQGTGMGTWSGPGITDPEVGMFDPSIAGIGTHTLILDFLESEGCPYQDSIMITINDLPTVTAQFDEIRCFDQDSTTLEIIPSGGDGNYTITLDGNTADLMNTVMADNYDILVVDGNGCTAETSVSIPIPNVPMLSISGNTMLTLGDSATYIIDSAIFSGVSIDSIIWSANGTEVCNDPTCFSLDNQMPQESTVYDVTVHFNDGCSVSATLTVEVDVVEPPSIFVIPNIISPNNDGQNDEWQFVTNNDSIVINSIQIFDRWGSEVWTFEGPTSAIENAPIWDGTFKGEVLQPGVYVYFVNYSDERRLNRIRSGDITIIN